MIQKNIILCLSVWYSSLLMGYTISIDEQTPKAHEKLVQIKIDLHNQETIVQQTMRVSLDNPNVEIGHITYEPTPHKKYIPEFADSKEVFEDQVTLNIPLQTTENSTSLDTVLHLSFLTLPDSKMNEQLYNLSFHNNSTQTSESVTTSAPSTYSSHAISASKVSFTDKLQNLVQSSDNIWFRLLFAFLLGLLLSLTPCIYPMIPITIGILHNNQTTSSVTRNFLGALCYAFGLSTTFAALGLLAAFAGASFGSLLSKPLFVIILVAFIGYMALTMIGVIDLRLPSFLQRSANVNSSFGPFVSAYLFGIISGSIASPCVSPGLALLLTIVATMGNVLAGFILLFCFGIGMSVPLIIIGTFSSSMNMLPQAGQWMVEIKKALGFVMLATCLYYLNNILPTFAFNWLVVAFFLFAAIFYIIDAQKDFDTKQKTIKSLIGIILLAVAIVMGMRAYDRTSNVLPESHDTQGVQWADNYQAGLLTAQAEHKLLVLDFWANHCTICKAIDKKIFKQDIVQQALQDQFVFVKIDCTSSSNAEANELKNTLQVFAQPAILVINPQTGQVIKRWSSEPYSMTPEQFIETMKQL